MPRLRKSLSAKETSKKDLKLRTHMASGETEERLI